MSEPQSHRTRALRGLAETVMILGHRARTTIAAWFRGQVVIARAWLSPLDDWADTVEGD